MQTHTMRVIIPENHWATIEFPETIRSGPVELIVLVPPPSSRKIRGRFANFLRKSAAPGSNVSWAWAAD